jgi:hypothetical protein
MTELVLSASRAFSNTAANKVYPNRWRLLILAVIFALVVATPQTREIMIPALSDAFLAVSVFVAATLALVYWFEKRFSFDLGEVMANNRAWQPVIAAGLGALPGCGGAIIVVTQFTRGYASFGAFISVLVATMGDAAFVLIARAPATAGLVIGISLVAGIITGYIVDKFHGKDFLAVEKKNDTAKILKADESAPVMPKRKGFLTSLWLIMATIGFWFGIMLSFQIDLDAALGFEAIPEPVTLFGAIGALVAMVLWATARDNHSQIGADSTPDQPLLIRVVKDTNFVTSWVVMAFVLYEIAVVFFGLDVGAMFSSIAILLPLIAVLIGFIPGCGPQIVVAQLYVSGVIPFGAQIANAIANDGDALFPALALAPRAAILATLYSAVPAVIIGYAFFFIGW